jgi:hypothetical protein
MLTPMTGGSEQRDPAQVKVMMFGFVAGPQVMRHGGSG